MIHILTYYSLIAVSLFLSILSRRIALNIGRIFGLFMYYCIPLRKNVVKINLCTAFPNKNDREIKKLTLQIYKHYGLLMFEFIRSHTRQVDRKIFKIDNQTKKILSSKDGFILMTAHLGNWEMILPAINYYKKITAVVRHHNNVGGNRFFSECRNLSNVTLISNKGSRKKMIEALNLGEVLGLASDQNAKDRGTYINFFGRKASIPKGAGHFHYLTEKQVIFGFCILNKDLSYTFKLREIKLDNNCEQKEKLIVKLNVIYSQLLEKEIKKKPFQYFWFHKKWDKCSYDL
tara:strand:+ start:1609 stop:2475 length:867 start_codon:yes stop_codon:yes gene_type:complete